MDATQNIEFLRFSYKNEFISRTVLHGYVAKQIKGLKASDELYSVLEFEK